MEIRKPAATERVKLWERPAALPVACMLASAMVVAAHISGSTVPILLSLAACLAVIVWGCRQSKAVPVLLFFLPWSPLMKQAPGSISVYTIGLIVCCFFALALGGMKLTVRQVVPAACIMAMTLASKILQGNSITKDYLVFLIMLFLFPCVTRCCARSISFKSATLFFACGIITAALTARFTAHYANISQYIVVETYLTVTRLSGFYGDPNFYAAHISACLAGMFVLLSCEKDRLQQFLLAVVSVMLLYCGLLSASKTFIITVACLLLFWLPILLERSGYGTERIRVLIGLLCAGVFILLSPAFRQLLKIVDARFSEGEGIAGLTTNRTDLWLQYLYSFSEDLVLTLFGVGYTSINLLRKASHNSVIQSVYQFGLLGIPALLAWIGNMLTGMFPDGKLPSAGWKYALLLCVGAFLPWMALDMLLFDEFFLIPVYVLLGLSFAADRRSIVTAEKEVSP